jgi:cold shock CspA family protein
MPRSAGQGTASAQQTGTHREPRDRRFQLVKRLFERVVTDGHEKLALNVARAPAIFDRAKGTYDDTSYVSEWQRARVRLADGSYEDRRLTPHLLLQHVLGHLDVAVEAPGFTTRLTFDFDLRLPRPGAAGEEIADAQLRFWAEFARFWDGFAFDAARQPVLQASPNGGIHADLPLDRPYPAYLVREWAEHRARQLGLRVEIFPSGKPLRAPCGRGMALLVPRRPDQPEQLELERHGVFTAHMRGADGQPTQQEKRHIDRYLELFLERYEAARRPLTDWIAGAPAWDPTWGPYGAREKKTSSRPQGSVLSQHIEDMGGRGLGPRSMPTPREVASLPDGSAQGSSDLTSLSPPAPPVNPSAGRGTSTREGGRGASPPPPASAARHRLRVDHRPPSGAAVDDDATATLGTGQLLRGRAWRAAVGALLAEGLAREGMRHDSVLKLTWHWASEGHDLDESLRRLEAWCRGFAHRSRLIATRGLDAFVRRALYDARRYYLSHCQHLAARRREGLRDCAALDDADRRALEAGIAPELLQDGLLLLGVLRAYAGPDGRVVGPVRLSGAMLEAVLGDRRLLGADGARRRVHVVLVEEFVRLGILTLHRNYAAGSHGREYCCWYRFGSGRLPGRDDAGDLVLAVRPIEEGELAAISNGAPLAQARAKLASVAPTAVDRPRAWWRRMFARRVFTVAEFLHAEERRVLPLPQPRRNPAGDDDVPTFEVLEKLGQAEGTVLEFSYARGWGRIDLGQAGVAFVHQTDIDERGFRDLAVDQRVAMELVRTPRGLRALTVRRLPTGSEPVAAAPPVGIGDSVALGPPAVAEEVLSVAAHARMTPTGTNPVVVSRTEAAGDTLRSLLSQASDQASVAPPIHDSVDAADGSLAMVPTVARRPHDTDETYALRCAVVEADARGDVDTARRAFHRLWAVLKREAGP